MEEGDACHSIKTQMLSDYDSDETIVDDSIPGSDEEEDELHLKRLFLSSDVSPTPASSLPLVLGQQSPEIQHVCKSDTGTLMESMKPATRQVCDMLSEEEPSQSLLRNWTKDSGNPESRITSNKDSYYCEPLVDDTDISGLCEDAQYLIDSTEYEMQETSLISDIIIKDHSKPENETVLLEDLENEKLQNKAPDVNPMSERGKVEIVREETECSPELSDTETSTDVSRSITSELKIDMLLNPLSESESLMQISDIVDSQQYLLFMEMSTDDINELTPELVEAINSMKSAEVQSARDQLGQSMVGHHPDAEGQMIKTQCNDDHTQIPSLTCPYEDVEHKKEEDRKTFSIQNTDKETHEGTPLTEDNDTQTHSIAIENFGHVSEFSSHCPGVEQQVIKQTSLQDSKEKCTITTDDWNNATLGGDSASCSQPSPSILINAQPTFGRSNAGSCTEAVRRSQRISRKVSHLRRNESHTLQLQRHVKAKSTTEGSKGTEKVLRKSTRLKSAGNRGEREKYSDSQNNMSNRKIVRDNPSPFITSSHHCTPSKRTADMSSAKRDVLTKRTKVKDPVKKMRCEPEMNPKKEQSMNKSSKVNAFECMECTTTTGKESLDESYNTSSVHNASVPNTTTDTMDSSASLQNFSTASNSQCKYSASPQREVSVITKQNCMATLLQASPTTILHKKNSKSPDTFHINHELSTMVCGENLGEHITPFLHESANDLLQQCVYWLNEQPLILCHNRNDTSQKKLVHTQTSLGDGLSHNYSLHLVPYDDSEINLSDNILVALSEPNFNNNETSGSNVTVDAQNMCVAIEHVNEMDKIFILPSGDPNFIPSSNASVSSPSSVNKKVITVLQHRATTPDSQCIKDTSLYLETMPLVQCLDATPLSQYLDGTTLVLRHGTIALSQCHESTPSPQCLDTTPPPILALSEPNFNNNETSGSNVTVDAQNMCVAIEHVNEMDKIFILPSGDPNFIPTSNASVSSPSSVNKQVITVLQHRATTPDSQCMKDTSLYLETMPLAQCLNATPLSQYLDGTTLVLRHGTIALSQCHESTPSLQCLDTTPPPICPEASRLSQSPRAKPLSQSLDGTTLPASTPLPQCGEATALPQCTDPIPVSQCINISAGCYSTKGHVQNAESCSKASICTNTEIGNVERCASLQRDLPMERSCQDESISVPKRPCNNMTFSQQKASAKQHASSRKLRNMHKRNFMGETKLHQASRKGDLKLVNVLIEAGVDVNQRDNAGWAAMHEASCKGYSDIILALLQAGADVNSKGLDEILPIHDAVVCNHFKAVEILLEFGANLYERDKKQENAFDKCRNDKMAELLKSHSACIETSTKNGTAGTEIPQLKMNCTPSSATHRYRTRNKSGMETLTILQDTENKQKKLLSTELQTSEDSDKYIEEMRQIQDVLNEIVTLQRNERDLLAKKYRASVGSFKQGLLRDKIAKLASRQKALLQVVHNQKQVDLKIVAYQKTKKSDANNGEKSSLQRYCDTSPGRNPISALCTVKEWIDANSANGSTMATKMPAVCRVPHMESNQFQRTFMRNASSSEISRTRAVPADAVVSEGTVQHSSNLILNEMAVGIENGLFNFSSCSSITPADLLEKTNDYLEFTALGSNSPNTIPVNSKLNITDKSNIIVKKINHQTAIERPQTADAGQHLQRPNSEKASHQADMSGSVFMGGVSKNGRPQHIVTGHRSASSERGINHCTIHKQSPKRQQICIEAKRKTRKVSMRKLIEMGKLKPGDDVLWFQLQDYSHKATLLPDGRIKDCSGAIYRDPAQWVKALLGNNILVSWKYVANKITYLGKKLSGFMTQEDFAPNELNHPAAQEQTTVSASLRPPAHTVLQVKEILLIDKSEFCPSHIMDQYWEEFMNTDSQDF